MAYTTSNTRGPSDKAHIISRSMPTIRKINAGARARPTRYVHATAWLGAAAYRAYYATLRLRISPPDGLALAHPDHDGDGAGIFALCERDVLALAGALAGRGVTTLVAPGRDGDWAAALLQGLGYRIVRGASARGGAAALRALLRVLDTASAPLGLVVDGPLGPPGVAKRGAIACALKSGRAVRAVGAAARRALVFPHTWSGIYLPLPFTRIEIVISDLPIDEAAPHDVTALGNVLTDQLAETRTMALARAARP
jgi:lysophospholipid acyltransferase (LPLAT)-like uncharacterized protein